MAGEKPHSYSRAVGDGRLTAPSAQRNREPIISAITPYVPHGGRALEIASGTGEHVVAFGQAFPDTTWQPTDLDPERLKSIDAWRSELGLANLGPAHLLDASTDDWTEEPADLVVTINLLHLIPESAARSVVSGVSRCLQPGGHWFLYGPFRSGGAFRSDGDHAFDADLKAHDPSIGYKDVETVINWAEEAGLSKADLIEMPANNLSLVFRAA